MMFNPRINTFLTLYREMNYRRTAELLNMTQPGVTQHIQHLEKEYGVKLFSYNGRVLSRTPEADILKRHLEAMLVEERAMRDEFSRQKDILLHVGATKTIGEFVLVPTVRRFLSEPHHSIDFVIDNTRVLLQMLEASELDFAVIEGVFDKTRYGYRLFKKEKFVGICGKNHRFAGKKVPFEEIFRETLLLREEGSGTRRLLEQAITDRGFSLDCFERVISVSNFSVISDMAARDNAITFAYQPVAQHRKDLAVFEVKEMQIEGEFNFVYCNRSIGEERIALLFDHQDEK